MRIQKSGTTPLISIPGNFVLSSMSLFFLITYSNRMCWSSNIWYGTCAFVNMSVHGACVFYPSACVPIYVLYNMYAYIHRYVSHFVTLWLISVYPFVFVSFCLCFLSLFLFLLPFDCLSYTLHVSLCIWLESYTQQWFDSSSKYTRAQTHTPTHKLLFLASFTVAAGAPDVASIFLPPFAQNSHEERKSWSEIWPM